MDNKMLRKVAEYNMKRKFSNRRKILLSAVSVVIVLIMLFTLIIPAFTLEAQTYCGNEEHEHTLACFSDSEADVESASVWESTMTNVKRTGVWADDVSAIADSQLGYTESNRNYDVDIDGTTVKGYTRYGEWYGDPYGDWSAMFVSFCLNYAGVDKDLMPAESDPQKRIEKLDGLNIFHLTGDADDKADADNTQSGVYEPKAGDLVFLKSDTGTESVRAGIVREVIRDDNGVITNIRTIEGNNEDKVAYDTYDITYESIIGYGQLPENPDFSVTIDSVEKNPECTCEAGEGDEHESDCPLYGKVGEGSEHESSFSLYSKDREDEKSYKVFDNGDIQFNVNTENGYNVSLTAAPDAFDAPIEEIRLVAREIEDEYARSLIEENVTQDGPEYRNTILFDIKIMKGEEEVQPLKDVSVKISGLPGMGDDVRIFHVEEDKVTDMDARKEEGAIVSMDTDHFSTYGVTYKYTVDFDFYTDKTSITGGTSIYLSDLLAKFPYYSDDNQWRADHQLSEATEVTCSDPSLFTITKVTRNGSQDWKLQSLKIVENNERLIIKYKDGVSEEIDITTNVKVIKVGDEKTLLQYVPLSNVSIDPAKCQSDFEYKIYNDNFVYEESGTKVDGVYGPRFISKTKGYYEDACFSITYKDAVTFANGRTGDVTITYKDIKTLSDNTAICGYVKNVTNVPAGFYHFVNLNGSYANKEVEAKANISIKGGYDINYGNLRWLFAIRDYDSYVRMKLSDAADIYVTQNTIVDFSDIGNGYIKGSGQDPYGTYKSGFATIVPNDIDIYIKYRGAAQQLFDDNSAYITDIGICPHYRNTTTDVYTVGSNGGNIQIDKVNSDTVIWNGSDNDISGYKINYIGKGSDATITFTPAKNFSLTDVEVNGKSVMGQVSNNQLSLTNITTSTKVDVYYERTTPILDISIRPHYRNTSSEDYTVGDTGGLIHFYQNASNWVDWDATKADETGYVTGQVESGSNADIYFKPTTGYKSVDIMVDGNSVMSQVSNNKLPLTNITTSSKVDVYYEKIPEEKTTLTVNKEVIGTGGGTFPFVAKFRSADTGDVILPEDGEGYTVERDNTKTSYGEVTFELQHKGSVIITGIPEGSVANIREVKHDGYTVLVMEDGTVQLSSTDESGDIIMNKDRNITFYNNPGVELPDNGGVGTQWFTWSGIGLLSAGLIYGIRRKRKRERRSEE